MSHPQRILIESAEQIAIKEGSSIPKQPSLANTTKFFGSGGFFDVLGRNLANSKFGELIGASPRIPDRVMNRAFGVETPEERIQRYETNRLKDEEEAKRRETERTTRERNFRGDTAQKWNTRQRDWTQRQKDHYGDELFLRVKDEMFPDGWNTIYGDDQIDGFRSGELDADPSVDHRTHQDRVHQQRLDILDRMNQIRQQERDKARDARDLESAKLSHKVNTMSADNARARLALGERDPDYYDSRPLSRNREEDERTVAAYDSAKAATSEIGSELKKGNLGALSFGNMMKMISSKSNVQEQATAPTRANPTTKVKDASMILPGETKRVGAGLEVGAKPKPQTVGGKLLDDLGISGAITTLRDTGRGIASGEGDADDVRQIDRELSQGDAGVAGKPDPVYYSRDEVKAGIERNKERTDRMTRFMDKNKSDLQGKSPDEVEKEFRKHERRKKAITSVLGHEPFQRRAGKSPDEIEAEVEFLNTPPKTVRFPR